MARFLCHYVLKERKSLAKPLATVVARTLDANSNTALSQKVFATLSQVVLRFLQLLKLSVLMFKLGRHNSKKYLKENTKLRLG